MIIERSADDRLVVLGTPPAVLGVSLDLLDLARTDSTPGMVVDGLDVTIVGLRYRITGVCPNNLHAMHLQLLPEGGADGAVAADG